MRTTLVTVFVLTLASSSFAGIVDWSAAWVENSALDMENSGWTWHPEPQFWDITEHYIASDPHNVAMTAGGTAVDDRNLVISISKDIFNDSSFEWDEFVIVVSGSAGVSYVPGSASSDTFGTITENGGTVNFFAPDSVAMGEWVNISFDVEVPVGDFTLDISQTPIPEPTTGMMLLAAAGLLLRRR